MLRKASVFTEKWGRNEARRTSVQRITLPFALNSEPWKILTLVMDSMDLPSMGLMTLKAQERARIIKPKEDVEENAPIRCWRLC